jgi:hypothetical protein
MPTSTDEYLGVWEWMGEQEMGYIGWVLVFPDYWVEIGYDDQMMVVMRASHELPLYLGAQNEWRKV